MVDGDQVRSRRETSASFCERTPPAAREAKDSSCYCVLSKMHGLGNDFMVLRPDQPHAHIQPKTPKQWGVATPAELRSAAGRPPSNPDVDFRPHLQCRRFGSGTVRQRRALLRALRAGQAPDGEKADPRGNQGRHYRAGRTGATGKSSVNMGAPRAWSAEIPFQAKDSRR